MNHSQHPLIPAPHPLDGARLAEHTARRVHTIASLVALIGAVGFFTAAGVTVGAIAHGNVQALGDLGSCAVTAAIWFSGAFRCHTIKHRPQRTTAGSLLRSPSDWLPLPFLDTFTIGHEPVEIVEPIDAAHRLTAHHFKFD